MGEGVCLSNRLDDVVVDVAVGVEGLLIASREDGSECK